MAALGNRGYLFAVAAMAAVGCALTTHQLWHGLTHETGPQWHLPAPNEVKRVRGHFERKFYTARSPYSFVTDGGEHLLLACIPDQAVNVCLADFGGGDLNKIAGLPARVSYFYALNRNAPVLNNIMLSVSVSGRELLDPVERDHFMEIAMRENAKGDKRWHDISLGLLVLMPLAYLWVFISEVRKRKRG